MADPGLRSYLYSQAEKSINELQEKGVISPSAHGEILKILHQEQGGGQQMGFPAPYPGQMQQYQSYPYMQQQDPYPMAQPAQHYQPPAQYSQPPPEPQPKPQAPPSHPPPEKHHSHMEDFGKRMGNNVANGMSSGFGLRLGSNVADSLWHKVT